MDMAAKFDTIRVPFYRRFIMAEEIVTDPNQQQVQLVVDEREMRTTFANGYRIYTTGEEVVVDFGFNMLNPNPQAGQAQMLFKAGDRVILSYPTLKRLSISLGQLIKRYEDQFGPIAIQPGGQPQRR
jgi:hypothetical protein